MRQVVNYLVFLFFILVLFIGCNSADPDPDPVADPLDDQAALLDGTWILKDASSATKDGNVVSGFENITLTFSGGSKNGGNYSTTNSASADVWPNSGTWTFQNGDKNKLLRSDNVVLSISLTSTTLRTSFVVSGGLKEGNWVFDFIKQ
ncbi:MAG: lipocalin family protein [Bacteroidota bacterium]|uniref:Lipocalin-like domain-containing protein n=1 Tax=marine metagenome TaxID=408172 RepID=A0A381PY63_9ZZZZ|nr:lipocalin family protein [Bacteroidota bacterium]|tara:strand:+ start:53 stop:496 length:444 start_codon:yes stop_codon:yes gene_type:complete